MQYRITLLAGIPKRQAMSGETLVVLDTGAALELDMSIEVGGGFAAEELRGIKRGLKFQLPGITGATFKAPVDCTIEVVVSVANISVSYQDNATVNANILGIPAVTISGQPVQVVNNLGAAATPMHVVGLTLADLLAVTLQDNAAIAVTSAGAAIVAANASRRSLRFTNLGTDPVALGFTGITWAKRVLVLRNGESWVEDRAANLAWAAICDATKTASLTVQEVIA
jgi:hypothetical protein